mmetsp:Transcript_31848/g.97996  ORF Transcript_31848/g.97996 Transcript_31848/m.97996 type:complete len:207 (-) Transcript_31848:69-689(-)
MTYKEYGLRFRLDLARRLSRLNRSQGGSGERQRLCQQVKPGERVLVLGSGFGLTTCMLAARAPCSEVVGLEPSPVAHEFALSNAKLNKVDGIVRSVHGDPFDPELVSSLGTFDRVSALLPWNRDGELLPLSEIVSPAAAAVTPGGALHAYYCETEEEFRRGPGEALRQMAIACQGRRRVELLWRGRVPRSSIGPYVYRVGMDFRLS